MNEGLQHRTPAGRFHGIPVDSQLRRVLPDAFRCIGSGKALVIDDDLAALCLNQEIDPALRYLSIW